MNTKKNAAGLTKAVMLATDSTFSQAKHACRSLARRKISSHPHTGSRVFLSAAEQRATFSLPPATLRPADWCRPSSDRKVWELTEKETHPDGGHASALKNF
jgi:hypothetical protein